MRKLDSPVLDKEVKDGILILESNGTENDPLENSESKHPQQVKSPDSDLERLLQEHKDEIEDKTEGKRFPLIEHDDRDEREKMSNNINLKPEDLELRDYEVFDEKEEERPEPFEFSDDDKDSEKKKDETEERKQPLDFKQL